MSQRNAVRWMLGVAAFLLLGAAEFATPAAATDLRELCQSRCRVNKVICTDSTLPGGGSAGSSLGCEGDCVDDYLTCRFECRTSSNRSCGLDCSDGLTRCTNSCRPATAACNDIFVACRNSCDDAPRCTQNAHCNGQVCQDGNCIAACKSTAQCKTRMGPDAICIQTGPNKGKCMLS